MIDLSIIYLCLLLGFVTATTLYAKKWAKGEEFDPVKYFSMIAFYFLVGIILAVTGQTVTMENIEAQASQYGFLLLMLYAIFQFIYRLIRKYTEKLTEEEEK